MPSAGVTIQHFCDILVLEVNHADKIWELDEYPLLSLCDTLWSNLSLELPRRVKIHQLQVKIESGFFFKA